MNFRIARVLLGIPLLASLTLSSPASAHSPTSARSPASAEAGAFAEVRAPGSGACASGVSQSSARQLDYVVLASLADSSNPLALSTHRGPASGQAASH